MIISADEFEEIMLTELPICLAIHNIVNVQITPSYQWTQADVLDHWCYEVSAEKKDGGIDKFQIITWANHILHVYDSSFMSIISYSKDSNAYESTCRISNVPHYVRLALEFLMNNRKNTSAEKAKENYMVYMRNKESGWRWPKVSKEEKKMTKQEKRIYPNIFDREGSLASIKDIQYFTTKKDKNTITIVWTDKGEKGRNKTTTVSVQRKNFDPEIGIAMAIARRYFGGRNEFLKVVDKATKLNEKRFNNRKRRAELKKKKKKGNK